jgi:ubiquinol-cytochrome c reductase iron-sulfur subunit
VITRLFVRLVALLVALRWALARRRHRAEQTDTDTMTRTGSAGSNAASGTNGSDGDPSRRDVPANPRAETLVAGLLLLAAVLGFGFTAVYAFAGHNNQLLGIALGGMFALLAAAAIIAGKGVVVQETSVEDRGTLLHEQAPAEITEMITSGGQGISRRVLLTGAAGVAGVAAATAAVTPLASVGPRLSAIHKTPWHKGMGLVDEDNRPYLASDIEIGSLYTALPENGEWEQLGSGLVVVRLPPETIHLPAGRGGWAPQGILAFSKICPHAACAVSLYRYPEFPQSGNNEEPALTCPCHYSTFLPADGGKLLFGPAGRPLPQLPVMIDSAGYLRANGGFDEDIGPSWVDVRTPKRT